MRPSRRGSGRAWAIRLAAAAGVAAAVAVPTQGVAGASPSTQTPIKHVVVIFQENISFDHYFGTYPNAANTGGQPFSALPGTPAVNGLSGSLLTANPNGVNPRRFDPTDPHGILTCSQNHSYTAEEKAFDGGAMDKFPSNVGTASGKDENGVGNPCVAADNLGYYDGNTVTSYWNYAQHYAMSDNSYSTDFGPSAVGAINVVSGATGPVDTAHTAHNALPTAPATSNGNVAGDGTTFSVIGDPQGYYDDCSTSADVGLTGKNVGDQLNSAGLSWGWFMGGFKPTTPYTGASNGAGFPYDQNTVTGRAVCNATHNVGVAEGAPDGRTDLAGGPTAHPFGTKADYVVHHEPFEYYASTANPHHLAPTSVGAIGTDTQSYDGTTPKFDTANHQYDMSDWDSLVGAIANGQLSADHLPAVSYLKAPGYQDGHAGYSDPLDEQRFVTKTIDQLQQTPAWANTAVVIAYDDSDGWYDHQYPGIQNPSQTTADALTGANQCGTGTPIGGIQGRCGFGPRQPLLVVSPWAKANFVDHNLSHQGSIVNFVQYNWNLGHITNSSDNILASTNATEGVNYDLQNMFDFSNPYAAPNAAPYFLDPVTGQPTNAPPAPLPQSGSGFSLAIVSVALGAVVVGAGTIGNRFRKRRSAA